MAVSAVLLIAADAEALKITLQRNFQAKAVSNHMERFVGVSGTTLNPKTAGRVRVS
jgi:hypothetical protein